MKTALAIEIFRQYFTVSSELHVNVAINQNKSFFPLRYYYRQKCDESLQAHAPLDAQNSLSGRSP